MAMPTQNTLQPSSHSHTPSLSSSSLSTLSHTLKQREGARGEEGEGLEVAITSKEAWISTYPSLRVAQHQPLVALGNDESSSMHNFMLHIAIHIEMTTIDLGDDCTQCRFI